MPRPTEYPQRRVDTKVRIREDQVDALAAKVEETGLSRNRLVEQAIDLLLKGGGRKPRLKSAPADPRIVAGAQGANARTKPRIAHVGQALADQSQDLAAQRSATSTPPKTRRAPRRNLG